MSVTQVERINSLRKHLKRKRLEISSFLDDAFYTDCRSILNSAMEMDKGRLFHDNPSKYSRYENVMRRPVYWKLIEKKLNLYMYVSASDFIADMRLLFDNCFQYNEPESSTSAAARSIEIHVEELFVKLLGEDPPSCDEIGTLGASLEKSAATELWKIICFYENRDMKVSHNQIRINPKNYSCACQRRMLEILRRNQKRRDEYGVVMKQQPSSTRSVPHFPFSSLNMARSDLGGSSLPSTDPVSQSNRLLDTVPDRSHTKHEDLQRTVPERYLLDAVPQNTRCDFSVGVVSPVAPCDHQDVLPEMEEDEIAFADA